ncbi:MULTISPECIES: hypothetical protein [unclassified Pseudomonas]|uniref:hypothetical protein n=1 Tax=unclassified Pseudomonas TaxID=196821 RepID=UPI00128B204C|nr:MULTISPECIES: hypothetical protein [unclassified Pseudomonas]MPQ70834.1 hypothetical protein [Pseudomonas sp. MWU12-2323]
MIRYLPQTDNPHSFSVLLIDTEAPYSALLACAEQRFRATKCLLKSLSLMSVQTLENDDLSAVSEAAALLLQEGCDVLSVLIQQQR